MEIKFLRKINIVFALILSMGIFAQTPVITAKQIIDKNIQVTGGLTQWKLLNTILLQGKLVLGVKDEYPVKIYQARPNLTKTIVMVNKKEQILEGFDGKKGYAMNYATNKLQEYPSYKPESFDTDFIDYEQKGFTAEFLGEEKVGNIDAYKIELTKNINKTIYFFDKQTYYLVKEIKKEETILYSEHRKVGNLVMPFKIESSSQKKDFAYVMLISKIELNKAFFEGAFVFK